MLYVYTSGTDKDKNLDAKRHLPVMKNAKVMLNSTCGREEKEQKSD